MVAGPVVGEVGKRRDRGRVKAILGICAAMDVLAYLLTLGAGCYPHDCKPNDRTCWPCEKLGSTNPACVPPLEDTKAPDAGARSDRK
jgi:hypothetical protein